MPAREHYDALIIGTGFGGSTVALKLARAGKRVLLLERGRWVDRDDSAWDPVAIQIERKYRGPTPYEVDERRGREVTYPDDAVGGKSVFYGAASFRLRERDFAAANRFDERTRARAPSMDWPIGYDTLRPGYEEAERLIGIAGVAGADPTEPPRAGAYPAPPAPYGRTARRIAGAAERLGLRPFPIPLAINFQHANGRPACVLCMTCDLFPCKICAKNDLSVTVLKEAQRHGAVIRDRVIARRLVMQGSRVAAVECVDLERPATFRVSADLVVSSAGAISSAALLLASGLGTREPNGRLVGRYLMRHCAGIVIGIFPFRTNPERQFHKQLALTDFYFGRPDRQPAGPWGMIQALQTPPPEFIAHGAPYPFPIGAIGAQTVRFHAYLLCIAEDLPQAENRVEIDPSRTDAHGLPLARVFHQYLPRDVAARRALYREAARILRKAGSLIRVRLPIHTYSHAVGTCRFGDDPATAVLDPWCNFHGVPNLFVVDGSCFPSSGGVNPSLTIAANGLRVGDHLVTHWDDVLAGRR